MQRDFDLIRHILLTTEQADIEGLNPIDYMTDNFNIDLVKYNIHLLVQAGYLDGLDNTSGHSIIHEFLFLQLTFKGHELLDNMRDDTIYNEVKTKAYSAVQSLTLSAFSQLLSLAIQGRLNF